MSNKIQITNKQFDSLKEELDGLFNFLHKVCSEENFRQIMVSANIGEKELVDNFESVMSTVRLIAGKDIFGCFEKLGYPLEIDLFTAGGQMLMMVARYMMNLNEGKTLQYQELNEWEDTSFMGRMIEIMNQAVNVFTGDDICVKSLDGRDDFLLGIILYSYDRDLWKTYRVHMYRIASLIAKADGKVNKYEAKWLTDIMTRTEKIDDSYVIGIKASSEKLDDLIGLETVKRDVRTIYNFVKMKHERERLGMKSPQMSYHCVFSGNPGTGKTTIARILAGIYKELGVLKSGHLVEADRSCLVAEYVGQTAVKTNKIIDKALDGVLFVDEAYSLVNDSKEDYGKEAIATMLKRMEDDRDRLIVILAGYTDEMENFINSNPGLRSRFNRYINFPDYSAEELYKIFLLNAKKNEYTLTEDASQYLKERLATIVTDKPKDFGNARYVRNLFEKTIEAQSNRLASKAELTKEDLAQITKTDLQQIMKIEGTVP